MFVILQKAGTLDAAGGVLSDNILASAMPANVDSKTKRTTVSAIRINPKNFNFKGKNDLELFSNVNTLFHEFLHSIAFNGSLYNNLKKDLDDLNKAFKTGNFERSRFEKEDEKYFYLSKLRHVPGTNPLIDDEHWNPAFIPNDLMVPVERIDSIISIFTMEYMDLVNNNVGDGEFIVRRKGLQPNYIAEEINSFEEFFQYKCEAKEEESKYPTFCTEIEKRKVRTSCDPSYLFKAKCGPKLVNNCYEKVADKNENCLDDSFKGKLEQFESRGYDSRCIESGDKTRSYCMRVTFDGENLRILFKDDTFIECNKKNSSQVVEKEVNKKQITFRCPDVQRFKDFYERTKCPNMCHGRGFCINGKCDCFAGYDSLNNCKELMKSSKVSTSFA